MSRLTSDGAHNLYGTTDVGGLGWGTVFELSPNGKGGRNEAVLYTFTGGQDGGIPASSPVIFDSVGNLYGTTAYGGNLACPSGVGCGVVFELSLVGGAWIENVLYSFCSQGDCA